VAGLTTWEISATYTASDHGAIVTTLENRDENNYKESQQDKNTKHQYVQTIPRRKGGLRRQYVKQ